MAINLLVVTPEQGGLTQMQAGKINRWSLTQDTAHEEPANTKEFSGKHNNRPRGTATDDSAKTELEASLKYKTS